MVPGPAETLSGLPPTPFPRGAAHRLSELGYGNWRLFDAEDQPGGLAKSYVDERGFTWDIGGHVLFSHYEYFDNLMDTLLKDSWFFHNRQAWIWMNERFIPYPLQNNIRHLPKTMLIDCLKGIIRAVKGQESPKIDNFSDWLRASFGNGLCCPGICEPFA